MADKVSLECLSEYLLLLFGFNDTDGKVVRKFNFSTFFMQRQITTTVTSSLLVCCNFNPSHQVASNSVCTEDTLNSLIFATYSTCPRTNTYHVKNYMITVFLASTYCKNTLRIHIYKRKARFDMKSFSRSESALFFSCSL